MICFRQSRFKLALQTAMFGLWTAVLALMAFVSAHADGLWPYLALSLFAPLALAGAVASVAGALGLADPAALTTNADGVAFKSWRGERHFAWADIVEFIVLPSTGALRSPACETKSGPRRFVSFGRNWEHKPEEIVAALHAARTTSALSE